MGKVTLQSPVGKIIINEDTARKLEIKLNLQSELGNEWYPFGDVLYKAHARQWRGTHEITQDQFAWVLQNM